MYRKQQKKGNCNVPSAPLKFGQCLEFVINCESNLSILHEIRFVILENNDTLSFFGIVPIFQ